MKPSALLATLAEDFASRRRLEERAMLRTQRGRIELAIAAVGMTKTEAAKAAGMGRQVLTDILSGRIPGYSHLHRLAAVLGVTADDLMPDADE